MITYTSDKLGDALVSGYIIRARVVEVRVRRVVVLCAAARR